MANTKEIQKRMKSIRDTMKITSAMYMISSAKLRSAKQKLEQTEPYFYTLQSAIARFLRHMPDTTNRYFDQREQIPDNEKKRGYIVITADKGLAGAYNHNVIKMAQELFSQGENNKLFVVGELGRQYFAKEGLEVDAEFKYTVQNPSLHRARVIADYVMDLYVNGELDEVYLVYTKMEILFHERGETEITSAGKRGFYPSGSGGHLSGRDQSGIIHGRNLRACGSKLCNRIYLWCAGGVFCQ